MMTKNCWLIQYLHLIFGAKFSIFIILVPNISTLHMPTIKLWKLILRIGILGSKDSTTR